MKDELEKAIEQALRIGIEVNMSNPEIQPVKIAQIILGKRQSNK